MNDYWKAVWANKFTLTGYSLLVSAGLLTGAGKIINQVEPDIKTKAVYYGSGSIGYLGLLLLFGSGFGEHTLKGYRKTRSHIQRYGIIDEKIGDYGASYCVNAGRNLAAREAGLNEKT